MANWALNDFSHCPHICDGAKVRAVKGIVKSGFTQSISSFDVFVLLDLSCPQVSADGLRLFWIKLR